jgi:hypothetical protein
MDDDAPLLDQPRRCGSVIATVTVAMSPPRAAMRGRNGLQVPVTLAMELRRARTFANLSEVHGVARQQEGDAVDEGWGQGVGKVVR